MINHTMVLTISGTRRSEKAGGLDDWMTQKFQHSKTITASTVMIFTQLRI
jgi:hypothetical protein